ncbi:ROK family protein [Kordiimonas lacus]|uniref:fructokinase n=1 Tax=Kordiimonas lacus TaxID=637679 RepID=A0A1G6YPB3_9PROT|nr:ROK family protein [Kordiimonas lacus]SDD92150.1 fructokinase [Kordiimonas lacus]
MSKLIGAVEAGGTKFICAVGRGHDDIIAQATFPTTTPEETLDLCAHFFADTAATHGPVERLGIAAFGPLDLDPASATYGALLDTPKPGWAGTNFIDYFKQHRGMPTVLDTDVNGAVLAEVRWGHARGCDSAVYVTVGTGIGGGAFVNGKLVHGLLHPEIGHIPMPRAPGDEAFAGVCPFHDDCLEGLAAGPAIAERWGVPGQDLPEGHKAWEFEAFYLAQMCRSITLMLSPQKIVLGGGVMARPGLIEAVRQEFAKALASYVPVAARAGGLDSYIVPQSLGGVSGLAGAFALCS